VIKLEPVIGSLTFIAKENSKIGETR